MRVNNVDPGFHLDEFREYLQFERGVSPRTLEAYGRDLDRLGGLGGFLLPIMFGALVDITGVQTSIFMLMWGITLVSLVWMYWTEIVPLRARPRVGRLAGGAA